MSNIKIIVIFSIILTFGFGQTSIAQERHPAITDPSGYDPKFPPAMEELSFTSGGHKINGHIYMAAGIGPHPTIIMLHGFAGNEKNLDIAQALRRAGYNSVFFHYRGAWGSGGEFMIPNSVDDVGNIISYLKDPEWASKRRVNTFKIGLFGHSFGGLIGILATAKNEEVACYIHKAGWNAGLRAESNKNPEYRDGVIKGVSKDIRQVGGPLFGDPEAYVDDLIANSYNYNILNQVEAIKTRRLLVIGGLKDMVLPIDNHHRPFIKALKDAGATNLTELIFDDDHAFSRNRVRLAIEVIDWLDTSCWQ
ncbi:MAG: alpha/beta hydrolase family protein [Sphingomonadales bacterium]